MMPGYVCCHSLMGWILMDEGLPFAPNAQPTVITINTKTCQAQQIAQLREVIVPTYLDVVKVII